MANEIAVQVFGPTARLVPPGSGSTRGVYVRLAGGVGAAVVLTIAAGGRDPAGRVDPAILERQHAPDADPMLQAHYTKIEELARLPDDWDGDGAPRPSDAAARSARGFLREAAAHGLSPDTILADVIGGITLTFYVTDDDGNDVRDASVEIRNNGAMYAVLACAGEVRARTATHALPSELRHFLRGS